VVLNITPNWVPGFVWINVGLTILWFVTVTNAVQFLDGMDGLAAGLGGHRGHLHQHRGAPDGPALPLYLSAALVGACLGFLPYNFRAGRAQIFLGDGGATFIGFTLAGPRGDGGVGRPELAHRAADAGAHSRRAALRHRFVGIMRVVTGKVHTLPEWLAYTGRDHIHHRFEALGLTKKQSVLLIFFWRRPLASRPCCSKDATPREAVLILVQAACVLAIVAVLEGVGRWRPRE